MNASALVGAVMRLAHLSEPTAIEHVSAAVEAGTLYGIAPSILLAMAQIESRFDQNAERSWKRSNGVITYYCGVLQVGTRDKNRCEMLKQLRNGYMMGAEHLLSWLKSVRGHLPSALAGYNGGWSKAFGVLDGDQSEYALNVFRLQKELER